MKLLAGYDGSPCADEAIDDLRHAGLKPTAVEATVLSIADILPNIPGEEYALAFPNAAAAIQARMESETQIARRWSAQGVTRLRAIFPHWRVEAETASDSPYWGLISRAAELRADLVVLGSHGRGAISRALMGSVSHNVALYAPCSVRIGRASAARLREPGRAARIVIGWDNSPDAQAAIQAVAARHWPQGSSARVVVVLDSQLSTFLPTAPHAGAVGGVPAPSGASDHHQLVRAYAQRSLEPLRAAGLHVEELVVREGNPKHLIPNEAASWEADCIFLGARGLSRVKRILLGSVSATVAERAHCSVEIVR